MDTEYMYFVSYNAVMGLVVVNGCFEYATNKPIITFDEIIKMANMVETEKGISNVVVLNVIPLPINHPDSKIF